MPAVQYTRLTHFVGWQGMPKHIQYSFTFVWQLHLSVSLMRRTWRMRNNGQYNHLWLSIFNNDKPQQIVECHTNIDLSELLSNIYTICDMQSRNFFKMKCNHLVVRRWLTKWMRSLTWPTHSYDKTRLTHSVAVQSHLRIFKANCLSHLL